MSGLNVKAIAVKTVPQIRRTIIAAINETNSRLSPALREEVGLNGKKIANEMIEDFYKSGLLKKRNVLQRIIDMFKKGDSLTDKGKQARSNFLSRYFGENKDKVTLRDIINRFSEDSVQLYEEADALYIKKAK